MLKETEIEQTIGFAVIIFIIGDISIWGGLAPSLFITPMAGITRSGFLHNFLTSIVWNVVQVHDSRLRAPVVNYIE